MLVATHLPLVAQAVSAPRFHLEEATIADVHRHAVGLYDRAFALYEQALAKFSDAYCIQSRLAIQLTAQGRMNEAVTHYRRAYELMPTSFGRVESHCFGCENVFSNSQAQGIADEVFAKALSRDPQKPQTHYLLAYLRQEQGRYDEALREYRAAIALDPQYLNAWRRLNELSEHIYMSPSERDIARLKLLELDPQSRHVHYSLDTMGNLSQLWNASGAAMARIETAAPVGIYSLKATAELQAGEIAKLSPEMRAQYESYRKLMESVAGEERSLDKHAALSNHVIIKAAGVLMGANPGYGY
jgi:tetratricopeptide (TPR) repeat protein